MDVPLSPTRGKVSASPGIRYGYRAETTPHKYFGPFCSRCILPLHTFTNTPILNTNTLVNFKSNIVIFKTQSAAWQLNTLDTRIRGILATLTLCFKLLTATLTSKKKNRKMFKTSEQEEHHGKFNLKIF